MTATISKEYKAVNGDVSQAIERQMKWGNIILLSVIHGLGIYCLLFVIPWQKWLTTVWIPLYGYIGGFGVTGGAHRLWTHRSYKAKLPLRIILMLSYIIAGMNPIFEWVRDHRVHHKFSDTNADPHNANRGLFFSHMGWLMVKKHPEVLKRGREIDMSDIINDPVVAFQQKYFIPLYILLVFIIPIIIPCYLWDETLWNSIISTFGRMTLLLNVVWSVNSFAHIYGYRPYKKDILPAENLAVSMFSLGEGWHNYHHAFPWDYKVAEFGIYRVNWTTGLIDMFAKIGWAYDLRQATRKMVEEMVKKHGDGSHDEWGHIHEIPEEEFIDNGNEEKIEQNGNGNLCGYRKLSQ